ncbi:hypothetical protein Tco_0741168 [Tanacetum coccineum]
MMTSFFQMNTASTSGTGSLPSNIVANPKGELKAFTTRSGLVLDGPWKLIFDKRTKNQAKNDKTEHGME